MAAHKYSRQRESILRFLEGRTDHPTADIVYENVRMRYPNISLGTVYRNLNLLAELGKINKLSGFAGADHFDARTDDHCHFICTCCHKIIDLENINVEPLITEAEQKCPGKISGFTGSFTGICSDCA